jgi:quinol-cytochrome oxidoreductase complex cytochrome b subunit
MLAYIPGIGESLQAVVLGGPEIGPTTLTNFYTMHTTIVPVGLIVLMGFHFWRVRRAGGVVVPPARLGDGGDKHEKTHFLPNLLVRELAQALVLVALVVVLAAGFGAPLGERANPGMSPNPAKAPWYFVGFQELLIHFHPAFAVLVIPLLAVTAFVLLPYLTKDDTSSGGWFLSPAGRKSATIAAALGFTVTPLLVGLNDLMGAGSSNWFSGGLLPLVLIIAAMGGVVTLLGRRYELTVNESAQAIVVLLGAAFAVLTAIGVWFRGEGMALTWPWIG